MEGCSNSVNGQSGYCSKTKGGSGPVGFRESNLNVKGPALSVSVLLHTWLAFVALSRC